MWQVVRRRGSDPEVIKIILKTSNWKYAEHIKELYNKEVLDSGRLLSDERYGVVPVKEED